MAAREVARRKRCEGPCRQGGGAMLPPGRSRGKCAEGAWLGGADVIAWGEGCLRRCCGRVVP